MASYDEGCFDLPDNRPVPVPRNQQEAVAQAVAAERTRQAQVLYLSLLCQSTGVVTEVTSPKNGDDISDEYVELFMNNTNNPVRVQVFADLVTPGCGVFLSTTRDKSEQGKYDVLNLTANGRTESVSIIVLPTYAIFGRDFNAAIPMQGVDVIRFRIFDPAKLISYSTLYPQQGR